VHATTGFRYSGRIAAACAMAALAVAGGLTATPAHADATTPSTTVLTGEVVHGLSADTVINTVGAGTPMRIAVGLSTDSAARDAAYQAIFTKGNADYHHFLTPAGFQAQFGADSTVAATVLRAVTADGLHVVYDAPDGSYVELTGTAGQVDKTFAVTEKTYGLSGKTFTANAQAPTVPTGVEGITGLTSLTDFATADVSKPAQDDCEPTAGTVGGLTAGPAGACLGITTPSDLWSVYDQPSTDRGAGQKVAIFGEGQLDDVVSDLRLFEKDLSLPTVPVRRVLVGDDLSDDSGAVEWDLDSDASTGMAPDLQELDYYFGSDLSDASIGGTYSAWVNDPDGPATGNSSFGGSEQLEYLGGFILDPILQQAAMEGRTMFASAGDGGGSCLPGANGVTNDGVPCVEYPASSPYVVGVGGTVLYTATSSALSSTQATPAKRADEYSWNYSGGGQSDFEQAPSWQVAALPAKTAVPCTSGANVGADCRGVPDVSAQSGDIVTNGYDIVSAGVLTEEGGTSLSSPLWAGMWSRVVAAHPSGCSSTFTGGSTALGFAQEDLYNLANDTTQDPLDFFDVGGVTDSMPSSNGQQATLPRDALTDPTGYDYVSGLGSPDVTNIAKALDCDTLTPAIADTPVTNNDITDIYSSTAGCPTNGTISDPAGDEVPALPTNEALDLTSVTLSNTTSDITFAADVTDLSANPGDLNYAFEFKYGDGAYAVSADRGPTADSFSLYSLAVTSTPVGLGVQAVPTDLSDALTGNFTGNIITVDLPLAVFNSTAAPAERLAGGGQLSGITIYTNNGPAATALANDFNVEPIDQAEFFQCLYTLGSGMPTASVPEAPVVALIPVVGLLAAGGIAAVRRRRRGRGRT
jgi:pseudomonalisin